jgi:hypothetical protein
MIKQKNQKPTVVVCLRGSKKKIWNPLTSNRYLKKQKKSNPTPVPLKMATCSIKAK